MEIEEKKISLFLDTNVFQSFWTFKKNNCVFLDNTGVPSDYYQLLNFIEKYRLDDQIEICIPSVVIMECKQHMRDCFSKSMACLDSDLKEYKKLFGDLLEISRSIKIQNIEYSEYVDELFKQFIENPRNRCKVVSFAAKEDLFDRLLSKSLIGEKPFFTGTLNGKSHTDAGFKDAIIAEIIYSYCREAGSIGILISQDYDFADPFESQITPSSKFVHFRSIEDTVAALTNFYEADTAVRLRHEFEKNTYWHEYLLHEAGIELDEAVTERSVNSVTDIDGTVFEIKMNFTVNEAKYHFDIQFDSVANDILSCPYNIEND